METLVKQARTARHSQFVACGANMKPEKFKTSFGFKDRCMLIEAPGREIPSCRSKCPNGKTIERTYDYVFASQSLQGKLENMEVAEDFESRRHKTVTFLVERGKEIQDLCELKMPKALPGYSGGKLSGRTVAEGAKEVEGDEEEVHRWRTRAGSFESTTRGVFATVVEEKNAGRSSAGDVAKEPFQQVGWI